MEELTKRIIKEAQIDAHQAELAIKVVIDFIKEKLPPMMHGAVDNFLYSSNEDDLGLD